MFLFLKGLLIGFVIAAVGGPLSILCVQRSLRSGFKWGLATGMGAATADALFGLIAGLGLTAISSVLIAHQMWVRVIGGVFLIYLGIKLCVSSNAEKNKLHDTTHSLWRAYTSGVLLTLTNPTTILYFIAVFSGLGIGTFHPSYYHAIQLVSGIFVGSGIWWVILSGTVAFVLHHMINEKVSHRINQLSGFVLILFGLFSLKI